MISPILSQIVTRLVAEGPGRFRLASRGKTGIIYVPSHLVTDSTFPLGNGEQVLVRIDGERLIVEKTRKKRGSSIL